MRGGGADRNKMAEAVGEERLLEVRQESSL